MIGRWFVNLLLLLALLAAVSAMQRELARTRELPTLAEVFVPELRLIEVAREGEPRIRIERAADGWRQTEPLRTDADPARVGRLLALLEAPVLRTFPAAGAALDELDLTPPKLRLRFDDLHLAFGGLDPIGRQRYVESEGLVHLIDERFHQPLLAPPIDYVAPWPIPREFMPVAGTFDGIALDLTTLNALGALVAERIEPLTGHLDGRLLELRDPDGQTLRFLVSDDRRRWSRPDRDLRYVLTQGPLLVEDAPGLATEGAPTPFGLDPDADPDRPVSGDLPPVPLPAIRLRPDDAPPLGPDEDPDGAGPDSGFGAEPYKEPPPGFGENPFETGAALPNDAWPEPAAPPGAFPTFPTPPAPSPTDSGSDPFAPDADPGWSLPASREQPAPGASDEMAGSAPPVPDLGADPFAPDAEPGWSGLASREHPAPGGSDERSGSAPPAPDLGADPFAPDADPMPAPAASAAPADIGADPPMPVAAPEAGPPEPAVPD